MYFPLILFFASLFGIAFMIGRKLLLVQSGEIQSPRADDFFETPYIEQLKHVTIKNTKKFGYNVLVSIIRMSVRFSNFARMEYQDFKLKIKRLRGEHEEVEGDKGEASKFLKMISEYKAKLRRIRERVKEEENL